MEAIALKHAEERTKMLECICQSRQFAAEYDRKKEALQKAKEETQYNFSKKKAAISEKKQMFKEKEEVSHHFHITQLLIYCSLRKQSKASTDRSYFCL